MLAFAFILTIKSLTFLARCFFKSLEHTPIHQSNGFPQKLRPLPLLAVKLALFYLTSISCINSFCTSTENGMEHETQCLWAPEPV